MPDRTLQADGPSRAAPFGETNGGDGVETAHDVGVILDVLPAAVGYWDADLRNGFANDAYGEFLGVDPQEIRGWHMSEVLEPELYALNRPYVERALAGERQEFDRSIIDPAGEQRHVRTMYIPDVVDGKVRGFSEFATDVTAVRVAERAQAAVRARFQDLLESAPDAMVIVDADGEIVLINAQVEKMFGYAREELLGEPIELLLPGRLRDRHGNHRSRYSSAPRTRSMGPELELFGRRKDGSELSVEISLSPLKSEDGTLVSSAIRDVSRRTEVEDELRRSRQRLAEAERVAGIGSMEWDLVRDHTTWSDGLFQIYGLTPDQFDPSSGGAAKRVYPDDRERVTQTLERAIADRSSFTIEYRTMRADGRLRTLRGHGDVVVDDTGEPIRVVGIVQDITDAKLAQEALESTSLDLERRAAELQQLAMATATERPATPHAPLTSRQLEILRLIAQGLTNAAIAERLVVTEGTIKWHVKQILAKTCSSNRAEAVARVLGPGR